MLEDFELDYNSKEIFINKYLLNNLQTELNVLQIGSNQSILNIIKNITSIKKLEIIDKINSLNSSNLWDIIIYNNFNEKNSEEEVRDFLTLWEFLNPNGYIIVESVYSSKMYPLINNLITNTYINFISTEDNTRILYGNKFTDILKYKKKDINNGADFCSIIKKKKYSNLDNIENIFLVTSVINCFTNTSVYTREERYLQTQNTIKTIRDKIPNCFICLIDASTLTIEETDYFNKNVDMLINCDKVDGVASVVFNNKHAGENVYTLYAFDALNNINEVKTLNDYSFKAFPNLKNIFKISGRYFLNETFDYNEYNNEFNVIKIVDPNTWIYKAVSSFYKINKNYINDYILHLKLTKPMLINNNDLSVVCEHVLFLYIMSYSSITKNPKNLGTSGNVALNGTLCKA